jgi:hypothetical protein
MEINLPIPTNYSMYSTMDTLAKSFLAKDRTLDVTIDMVKIVSKSDGCFMGASYVKKLIDAFAPEAKYYLVEDNTCVYNNDVLFSIDYSQNADTFHKLIGLVDIINGVITCYTTLNSGIESPNIDSVFCLGEKIAPRFQGEKIVFSAVWNFVDILYLEGAFRQGLCAGTVLGGFDFSAPQTACSVCGFSSFFLDNAPFSAIMFTYPKDFSSDRDRLAFENVLGMKEFENVISIENLRVKHLDLIKDDINEVSKNNYDVLNITNVMNKFYTKIEYMSRSKS